MPGVRCGPICFQNRISNVAGTICLPNGFNQQLKLRNPNFAQFPFLIISPGMKVKQISMVYEAAYHHKSLRCIGILHKMRFIWKSLDLWWNQISQLISQSVCIILEDFLNSMQIWHLYIRGAPPLNLSFITSRLLMLLVTVNLDDMRQKWRGLIAPSQINDISKHGLSSPKSWHTADEVQNIKIRAADKAFK